MTLAVLNMSGVTFSGVVCANTVIEEEDRVGKQNERRTAVRVGVEIGTIVL